MRNFFFIGFVSFLTFSYFSSLSFAQGVGGVSLNPKRIVFEGRKRSAEVTLINQGAKATTYRIYFDNMRMEEDGKYTVIKESGPEDHFSDKLIRYSPRQVTIPAGGTQTVRLMVRKPKDLRPGEYRSHLFFQSLPSKDSGASLETQVLKDKELSVKLIATFAISIPIIVRHGKIDANITISDLAFTIPQIEDEKPQLSVKLNRKGKRSVYGNLIINFQSGSTRNSIELGRINGIAIFTPNKSRVLNVGLYPPEGVDLQNGTLSVTFQEDLKKGKGVFAEEKLSIR